MAKKLTKLEGAVWKSLKHRRKRSTKHPHLYDSAETFETAVDNAKHRNNQHRLPKKERD
jgi:hypothetical protein